MKKAIGMILMLAVLLAGCGGGAASSSAPKAAPEPAAPKVLNITFSNASDYIFNEIYISPTAANEWGEELLGSTSVLKSNGSIDVQVPAYDFDNYDIRVVDEDRDEYLFGRVPLQNGSEVAIYFGEDGLAADVSGQGGDVVTVIGELNGGDMGGGANDMDGQGDTLPSATVTGTGNDTNGQYTFTVYNESDYDIYAIYMGVSDASSNDDLDILPQILPAGEGTEVTGIASQGDWLNTEWTLYVVDVDGDASASYETFNPWTISYVDITWDTNSGGYVCSFNY